MLCNSHSVIACFRSQSGMFSMFSVFLFLFHGEVWCSEELAGRARRTTRSCCTHGSSQQLARQPRLLMYRSGGDSQFCSHRLNRGNNKAVQCCVRIKSLHEKQSWNNSSTETAYDWSTQNKNHPHKSIDMHSSVQISRGLTRWSGCH